MRCFQKLRSSVCSQVSPHIARVILGRCCNIRHLEFVSHNLASRRDEIGEFGDLLILCLDDECGGLSLLGVAGYQLMQRHRYE